jgi:phi13 family phage major tail protein
MAKIGLENFLYGILTEASDGTATYGSPQKPGKAISCNVSISSNDAKLYADDSLAESDTSFQSGTVSMEVDNADVTTQATLLGHTVTGDVMVRNANDVAPYVALGRIVTKMVGGQYKYKVEFLNKVKFSEPSQENTTKGESVEFGTTTLEGIVSTLANGDWSKTQTFDSLASAKTFLESLFGTTPSA